MGATRYVQVACPVCGAMVRIMGEQTVPETCPDCTAPLGWTELRNAAGFAGPEAEEPSGPRSAMVRLFAIRR